MRVLPMRLRPGDDLRGVLDQALDGSGTGAAFIVSGIGSLRVAKLRLAGANEPTTLVGDTEILTLGGTLSLGGAHLHMTLADSTGRVMGGHVGHGCIVRTTVELLVGYIDGAQFWRVPDPATGYDELVVNYNPVADG